MIRLEKLSNDQRKKRGSEMLIEDDLNLKEMSMSKCLRIGLKILWISHFLVLLPKKLLSIKGDLRF